MSKDSKCIVTSRYRDLTQKSYQASTSTYG